MAQPCTEESKTEISQSGNTKSYFAALSGMVALAGSEWSFAQLRLEADTQTDESASIVAVIKEGDKIYTLTSKGYLMKAIITTDGGNLALSEASKLAEQSYT